MLERHGLGTKMYDMHDQYLCLAINRRQEGIHQILLVMLQGCISIFAVLARGSSNSLGILIDELISSSELSGKVWSYVLVHALNGGTKTISLALVFMHVYYSSRRIYRRPEFVNAAACFGTFEIMEARMQSALNLPLLFKGRLSEAFRVLAVTSRLICVVSCKSIDCDAPKHFGTF